MVNLRDIRREVFASQPTLTLFYSEPEGDPMLLRAMLERAPTAGLYKGARGSGQPQPGRRPIVCAHDERTLDADVPAAESLRSLNPEAELELQHQHCSIQADQYAEIVEDFLRMLGTKGVLKQPSPSGLNLYYPFRAGELRAVAIFDLSLVPQYRMV